MVKNTIALIFFVLLNFSNIYSQEKTWAEANLIVKNTQINFSTFPAKNK